MTANQNDMFQSIAASSMTDEPNPMQFDQPISSRSREQRSLSPTPRSLAVGRFRNSGTAQSRNIRQRHPHNDGNVAQTDMEGITGDENDSPDTQELMRPRSTPQDRSNGTDPYLTPTELMYTEDSHAMHEMSPPTPIVASNPDARRGSDVGSTTSHSSGDDGSARLETTNASSGLRMLSAENSYRLPENASFMSRRLSPTGGTGGTHLRSWDERGIGDIVFSEHEFDYSMTATSDLHDSMCSLWEEAQDFDPHPSESHEWMGRSIETLLSGHLSNAPVLARSSAAFERLNHMSMETIDSGYDSVWNRRGSIGSMGSMGSLAGGRRGSLTMNGGPGPIHGGTAANYHNKMLRRDLPRPKKKKKPSAKGCGPNVTLSLMAREMTGKPSFGRSATQTQKLLTLGGMNLFSILDKPSGGIPTEVSHLERAIEQGDWVEASGVVSRLAPRLVGDPSQVNTRGSGIDDPSLPASASRFYAGGGKLGFERDAFVLSGGVQIFIRMFREPAFVGEEVAETNDARDLNDDVISSKLSGCWNEVLISLRELAYAMPALVDDGVMLDNGAFLPFLFTLLAHGACFDATAALIEEILSLQSQASPPPSAEGSDIFSRSKHLSPGSTFFLGNVPDLYDLWGSFSCRQLAQFCRIIALLVFEPEDRQLLDSPNSLKSMELLQLRRDRAARTGRDAAVDMNQSILLGDRELIDKLVTLMRIMNYAPTLKRSSAYHVMAHFPWIADTLVMLGMNELSTWEDVDRLDTMARMLLRDDDESTPVQNSRNGGESDDQNERQNREPSDLGSIADMLELLSGPFFGGNVSGQQTQLSYIIHVFNAAQESGVIGGRRQDLDGVERRDGTSRTVRVADVHGDRGSSQGHSPPGPRAYQAPFRRVPNQAGAMDETSDNVVVLDEDSGPNAVGMGINILHDELQASTRGNSRRRPRVAMPTDAANTMQFNAMILAPYQVEVLFVLCTLLGGRRKIDTQHMLREFGIIPVLEEMFDRLAWGTSSTPRRQRSSGSAFSGNESHGDDGAEEQPIGIHGPGCECNPENALRVQYLRLVHNFCDRDCENYTGRRLLLSPMERQYIFSGQSMEKIERSKLEQGLLSRVISAFMSEQDDSPYRFWLASCIEAYLRGSSSDEQMFTAQSGLLEYLLNDVVSERLHSAGSLQTAFDLLGELCKGNSAVLQCLLGSLDEDVFHRLMRVATSNLVDSNVFVRALLLSIERISARQQVNVKTLPLSSGTKSSRWESKKGDLSRTYLSHSWWDPYIVSLHPQDDDESFEPANEQRADQERDLDWFPHILEPGQQLLANNEAGSSSIYLIGDREVGHRGWMFAPTRGVHSSSALDEAAFKPNTVERLAWFLTANQTLLLRDLLSVVDLSNINHENICCLNTAVVVVIFAHRRGELESVLSELKAMNEVENSRRASEKIGENSMLEDLRDDLCLLSIDKKSTDAAKSDAVSACASSNTGSPNKKQQASLGDGKDIIQNFRELLWFWREYYTHRGRDRLSLEFSSHVRFQEWNEVVSLLGADNGSSTSLMSHPVRLPRSPYQRAPRTIESRLRGY